MLYHGNENIQKKRLSAKQTIGVLAVLVLLISGGLSLFASSHPDGLEWSIERVTGSTEIAEAENGIASQVQEKTALLPDYQFKGKESGLGTSFSGIAGSCLVLAVCGGVCYVISRRKKSSHIA